MENRWYKNPKNLIILGFLVILIILAIEYFRNPSRFTDLAWFALCVITAIYAFATIMILLENRKTLKELEKSRLDTVKPMFSLHPGTFTLGGDFHDFFIRNSGGVAKGIKIDINISKPNSQKLLFMTALDRDCLAYLDIRNVDKIRQSNGSIQISVKCKNNYNQDIEEQLSFDFSIIENEVREVIGQYSEVHEIQSALEDIRNEIGRSKSEY